VKRLPNQEPWLPSMTKRRKVRMNSILHTAKELTEDKLKAERHKVMECQVCFYIHGIAGQAFTEWTCRFCETQGSHPNTSVPMLCDGCAREHRLCRQCGADIDLDERRKLDPLG
jgi:hypothetical protein